MMNYTSGNYRVIITDYAKRYYIKDFQRKHKNFWIETFNNIEHLLSHMDNFILSSKVNKIYDCNGGYIAKCEFKISGSNLSPKTSGNRIIVYVDTEKSECHILLLYSKTHFSGHNETNWWLGEIKRNYRGISELFEP